MTNNLPSMMNRWNNPFRQLDRLQSDFERLFDELKPTASLLSSNGTLVPSCELIEEKDNYIARFDMPGIKKDQVKVELENNILTVSAERREEKKTTDERQHYSEISYGSYLRSFSLPTQVLESKIDAKFDNGVLTVKLPKAEPSKTKSITVQ